MENLGFHSLFHRVERVKVSQQKKQGENFEKFYTVQKLIISLDFLGSKTAKGLRKNRDRIFLQQKKQGRKL